MKTSNSAFELLTSDKEGIQIYKLKSNMMNMINDTIDYLEWTQTESAIKLKTNEKTIKDINNGNISKITLIRLTVIAKELRDAIDSILCEEQ